MEEIKNVSVGQRVADFELDVYLPDKKDFGKIKFSDVFKKGNWLILFFYPADYTFVCPTELADVAEHYAWQNSEKLLSGIKYPMAADPTHNLSKTFGVYDAASGLSLRGTFIIDPDGKLLASE